MNKPESSTIITPPALAMWLVLLALPALWVLRGNSRALAASAAASSGVKALMARQAVSQALARPSDRYLILGFLVCGFHVAFLTRFLAAMGFRSLAVMTWSGMNTSPRPWVQRW